MKFHPKAFEALEAAAAAIAKVPGVKSVDPMHDDESGEIWFESEHGEKFLFILVSDHEMPAGQTEVQEEDQEPLPPLSVQ